MPQINRRHLAPKKRRPLVVIDLPPQQQKMLRQKRLTTRQRLLVQKRLPRPHRRRPPTKNRQPSGNWSSPQSPLKTLQRTGHRSVVVRIVMANSVMVNSVMVNASNAMGNATDSAKTAREMQMGKAEIGVDAAVAKAADPMKARRAKIVTFSKMTTPR